MQWERWIETEGRKSLERRNQTDYSTHLYTMALEWYCLGLWWCITVMVNRWYVSNIVPVVICKNDYLEEFLKTSTLYFKEVMTGGAGSLVCTVTDWMAQLWFPAVHNFSLFHIIQTNTEALLAPSPMITGDSFPRDNTAGAWRWPPSSSAQVKKHRTIPVITA
jgi:hypothetical protein